jgi:TfoX/Sxy family transcriptional regulator of competence genes
MFGGVGFLLNGNMACGVDKIDLIVRVGPASYGKVLALPHVRPFDMTGRPMTGWIMVEPPSCETERQLKEWIGQGIGFTRSLPA